MLGGTTPVRTLTTTITSSYSILEKDLGLENLGDLSQDRQLVLRDQLQLVHSLVLVRALSSHRVLFSTGRKEFLIMCGRQTLAGMVSLPHLPLQQLPQLLKLQVRELCLQCPSQVVGSLFSFSVRHSIKRVCEQRSTV